MKNEKEILKQTQEWTREKAILEKEFSLKADKKNFYAKYKKKISTSKLLIFFLFLNCTIIELFTGWVTFKSIELSTITSMGPDFSPLVALIGAIVGEVIGFAVYSLKSAKENTKNGIVYEQAMLEYQSQREGEENNV